MRSAINFTVLPSVSITLAHADAVAAVAVATLHHGVAVLASVARARADAFIAPSDCAVLAAVNLTALTAILVALARAVEVVATRSMGATDDCIAEVSLAVFASVSVTLADTWISFSHSAMLSAVDFAVLAAVALLVAANAPAIIRTRTVRTALSVIARCTTAVFKGELFAVPALLVTGRRAAHLPRECSRWRVAKALLWLRLGLGLVILFC